MSVVRPEIVIVGAGIAGLWAFRTLHDEGYDVLVIEPHSLGGTQSLASQGMIHGGQRYALEGRSNLHSESIATMPAIWQAALNGTSGPDLRAARILSQTQVLWSPGGLTSSVTAYFASKAMNSRVEPLTRDEWPEIFRTHPTFKGSIYAMGELVVDIRSTTEALVSGVLDRIWKVDNWDPVFADGKLRALRVSNGDHEIEIAAEQFVFAAGLGNEQIARALWPGQAVCQRRPLKQVLVDDVEYSLYGHCIAADPRPRVTVSAHPKPDGRFVWYLGGLVAVKNVDKSDDVAVTFARRELETLFPQIAWARKRWSTLRVDRAEPSVSTGWLPDGPSVMRLENCFVAWPTKLTFAPAIAREIRAYLPPPRRQTEPGERGLGFAPPPIGRYPWEGAQWS